jgi:hypothetical protein
LDCVATTLANTAAIVQKERLERFIDIAPSTLQRIVHRGE